jgi:hypothetical protein
MSTFFIAAMLPPYLFWSLVVVGVDNSRRYVEAAAITVGVLAVLAYLIVLPGQGRSHLVEQWAAGREVDRVRGAE